MTASIPIRPLVKGTAFARLAMALIQARGNLPDAAAYSERWRDTPQVSLTLRAAMDAGATTDATWALPLATYDLSQEFVELYQSRSVLGRLAPSMRPTPVRVRVPRQLTNPTAAWVGEGVMKPVSEASFDTLQTELYKLACIVVISDELARVSNAEAVLRTVLTNSLAGFEDSQLLDPLITAQAGIRPASLTATGPKITSSGATSSAISTDLASMLGALGSYVSPYFVMHPRLAATIAGKGVEFQTVNTNGGFLMGVPVVVGSTAPDHLVVLLDAGNVLLSQGDIDLRMSRNASVQLDSSSGSPPTSSTIYTSLWEMNLTGLMIEHFVNWLKTRDDAAVSMVTAY